MNIQSPSRPICIYHGGCADGFTAAWAVWRALGEIDFHPGIYGEAPPDVTGRDVIMVDFSYKRPVIEAMAATCRTMLILDHHKTAQADLAGLPLPVGLGPTGPSPADWGVVDVTAGYSPDVMADHARACNAPHAIHAIFDMARSGAEIAWDFFHPAKHDHRPALVSYVADRDLWRFDLPKSREMSAWLYSHPFDFLTWEFCGAEMHLQFDRVVAEGAAILRQHDKNVATLIRNTRRRMVIGGQSVLVANVPHFMASDAGHALAQGEAFSATYYDRDGARVFSLRSVPDGADVAVIAAQYGGGGHRNAAGFQAAPGWEGEAAA